MRWSEQAHDPTARRQGTPTHWEAALETLIVPPNSDDSIISNPLGFFVTQISWTEQQELENQTWREGSAMRHRQVAVSP